MGVGKSRRPGWKPWHRPPWMRGGNELGKEGGRRGISVALEAGLGKSRKTAGWER